MAEIQRREEEKREEKRRKEIAKQVILISIDLLISIEQCRFLSYCLQRNQNGVADLLCCVYFHRSDLRAWSSQLLQTPPC